jgi:Effector Associated Constant Component 1
VPDLSGDRRFELVVEPRSDDYDAADDRWRTQVGTFHQELAAQVDTFQRGRSAPGSKGTIDELILALGSSGALTAAVECFRAWLQRDKSRSIDVRWDEDGVERHVTFSGDNVDAATVQEIARAAAARVGGPTWSADTAPS